ncbi:rhodanese-like domain-containing protein, partial [Candidatus Neomarinimicrobiota bacterium]
MPIEVKTADIVDFKEGNILDCRPSAAYNGWPLRGEANGGHIPGAISFPLDWFDELGPEQAVETLISKGIVKSGSVIITGYDDSQIRATAHHLKQFGFSILALHSGGMLDWAADPQLPIIKLPRYQHLVHAGWLKELLSGGNTAAGDPGSFILAHVNF